MDTIIEDTAVSVISQPFNGTRLYLNSYSIIDSLPLLEVIKKVCYTKRDVRAGWIGPGIPFTHSSAFQAIARWALQHWAMYSGFIPMVNRNGGRIIDVGCGMGYATVCLASILANYTITGIDVDELCIKFSNLFNRKYKERVVYIQDDFISFDQYCKYDYIFALEILEHIPTALHYSFVDKCLSLLSHDGLLFVTTPNALDEKDGKYSHIGLLNRNRVRAFLGRYERQIVRASFYDNRELDSMDEGKFIINDPIDTFEDTNKNKSHLRFVMRR